MSWSRRAGRAAVCVVALGASYAAGVLTGVLGSSSAPASPAGVLDQALDRISDDAATPVDRSELEDAAVQGMLAALDDRWASYRPGDYDGMRAVLDGRYGGIGVWVRRDGDGGLRISSVQSGSPAAGAGLAVGDRLERVAGQAVGDRSVAAVTSALRGSPGSAVDVTVARASRSLTVRVRRSEVTSLDVTVDRLAPTVARIRVAAFTRGTGRQVRDAMARLRAEHVGGVVLDLRDDPGGLLDEAVETASTFLDGGVVVSYDRRGAARKVLRAVGAGDTTTPLAVLVNGGTASAAEVVAAALQDRDRAVVVGSRTFGKGTVQEPSRLSDGSALELTVGRYLTPAGRVLDGVGVEPDIEAAAGDSTSASEQRAVDVLQGLLADSGTAARG